MPSQTDYSSNPSSVEDLYPDGSSPEVRVPKLSHLCSFGSTPLVMTGAIRQILLQHFVDPNNLISASLRNYLTREGAWSAEDDTNEEEPEGGSGIYIESIQRWRPELTESRPAVVIKEGDWKWRRLGIGDQNGGDWRLGRLHYSGLWEGTHTLFALGNKGAETQILASEIAKLLLWFGPLITDQLELHRFVIVSVGALSALQESTENYAVPVTVAYVSSESWFLQEDAPRTKRIVFKASEILGVDGSELPDVCCTVPGCS